jgi:hypothetical protein
MEKLVGSGPFMKFTSARTFTLLPCVWATDEEIYSSIIERYDRNMILRDFCVLILMIVVLDSRFDDGFEDEKIHGKEY